MSDNRSLRDLDGTTTVTGVIGWPVEHSLSPPMHNAGFESLGLNWVYVPFAVSPQAIPAAVCGIRALGIRGMNVTIPHKFAVAACMDTLSSEARALGAVNTVDNIGGALTGYNTDGPGFIRSLREHGEDVSGRRVALIGAGGAARAVALACATGGASHLRVINRTEGHAVEIAELVRRHAGECDTAALPFDDAAGAVVQAADVVINATPIGMHPHHAVPPVIPAGWLRPGQVVCDLVYNPQDTALLRAAADAGCKPVGGAGMLVHQGAIAFERWTGQDAPVEVMRQALLDALRRRCGTGQAPAHS